MVGMLERWSKLGTLSKKELNSLIDAGKDFSKDVQNTFICFQQKF